DAAVARFTSAPARPPSALIGGVDRRRLAPCGFAARARRAGSHLAVQFVLRLARHEVQREGGRFSAPRVEPAAAQIAQPDGCRPGDRKSTRLNSSHVTTPYA